MAESRRMRALKRWMIAAGISWRSEELELRDTPEEGSSVEALRDLKEGDCIGTIPKAACLTIKNSAACELIESAGLDGYLGLSVALMYERSLGPTSPWAAYLNFLPHSEDIPLLWSLDEINQFLAGTELHSTVKEDKSLVYEDWEENIRPLMESNSLHLKYFGVEQYFAAKSLIASRSFQIDDYHGFGMVPFADLFNHKTAAEDVHFTSAAEDDDDSSNVSDISHEDIGDEDVSGELKITEDDQTVLEMIMVKDVKAGTEVFNTYGSLGNAALLHRYGFTETDNPYDIVNIDLDLVIQWSSSLFSSRFTRSRLSLWRNLDYNEWASQNNEYFEISPDGEPQIELLILLYVLLLPEDVYGKLDLTVSAGSNDKSIGAILSETTANKFDDDLELSRDLMLTESVCRALLWLADKRDSLYGSDTLHDDNEALRRYSTKEGKLFYSLVLRVSERNILGKLRKYAAAASPVGLDATSKKASTTRRKRLKRT